MTTKANQLPINPTKHRPLRESAQCPSTFYHPTNKQFCLHPRKTFTKPHPINCTQSMTTRTTLYCPPRPNHQTLHRRDHRNSKITSQPPLQLSRFHSMCHRQSLQRTLLHRRRTQSLTSQAKSSRPLNPSAKYASSRRKCLNDQIPANPTKMATRTRLRSQRVRDRRPTCRCRLPMQFVPICS